MDHIIHTLLQEEEARNLLEKLKSNNNSWKDGKESAGSHAKEIKNNFQLDKSSKLAQESSDSIGKKIASDQLLKSYTLPRSIHGVMFTKSLTGQGYGAHVDNSYMPTGRSDLSFTIFLSSPNDYEGGELCLQDLQENQLIKLQAGQIIVYPSTSIHSVEKVISGERFVCVGWIQSYIPNNEDRKMLFGLDAGAKGLLAKHGRCSELDLIFQAYGNLLRRLGN